MTSKLSVLVVVAAVASSAWAGDVGSFCPSANADDCTDDECKCSALGTSVGDPINIADGNGLLRRKDIGIEGSLAPLKFLRSYVSKPNVWNAYSGVNVSGVPTPFGRASSDIQSLYWSHSFYTFVNEVGGQFRNENGRVLGFGSCSAPCWASGSTYEKGTKERMWRNAAGGGVLIQAADGTQRNFTRAPNRFGHGVTV